MKTVAITGNSGSGKTTVSHWLAQQGYTVIDGDAVTRDLAQPGSPYVAALVRQFGPDILDEEGNLLRRKVAERAFATPGATQQLTDATTPLIYQEIERRIHEAARQGSTLVFVDGALIVDTPFEQLCDQIVAVLSDAALQAARIAQRDGISLEAAKIRIARQTPPGRLRQRADFVLENNGEKQELTEKMQLLLNKLKETP